MIPFVYKTKITKILWQLMIPFVYKIKITKILCQLVIPFVSKTMNINWGKFRY
jgi:hypothetical protein